MTTDKPKPKELEIEDNQATQFMRKVYALRGTTPEAHIQETNEAAKLIAQKIRESFS